MMRFQSQGVTKYHQAMLSNAARWLVTDALGVLASSSDSAGYTDFVLNGVAGTIFLTRPLADFRGQPLDPANEAIKIDAIATMLGSAGPLATGDSVLVGTSDNADPTAGGALFDVVGPYVWTSASDIKVRVRNDAVQSVSGNGAADHVIYPQTFLYGDTEVAATAYGHLGSTKARVLTRSQASLPRAYVPTHLCVAIVNNNTTAKTIRAGVGFDISQVLRDFEIESRA